MVKAPTPEEKDCRRPSREPKVLTAERVSDVNRIKGLLFCQGITRYEPLGRNRRERLEQVRTGDGRLLPDPLKAQGPPELGRLQLLPKQIKTGEAQRDAPLAEQQIAAPPPMLPHIKGNGLEFAPLPLSEG